MLANAMETVVQCPSKQEIYTCKQTFGIMQKRMAFPTHMDTAVLYQWHGITNRQLCATVINTPKQEPSRTKKGDKDDSLLRDTV